MHQPVMGTHLELQITAPDQATAQEAEALIVAEAMRLQDRFTVFDEASELCRWRSGALAEPGPELAVLLGLAADWQRRSGGAFNPLAGVLTDRWLAAEQGAEAPPADELAALAASIREPRFDRSDRVPSPGTAGAVGAAGVAGAARGVEGVEGDRIVRLGPCDGVDLNALAKGHVVDLLAARAMAALPISRLVVNAGGDLVHRGDGVLGVRVEDPHHPYDNVPPLVRIEVANRAVATSGRARRWFLVAGRHRSRVLDPRTGQPVDDTPSATVVAPDAATADVLATVASVLPPEEAVAFVDGLALEGIDAACLVVDAEGAQHASAAWPALIA
ncbi:MAG: FAD:protein FMN transferase [Acidimicrobiales bacterium]